jgi:hypothetical protein
MPRPAAECERGSGQGGECVTEFGGMRHHLTQYFGGEPEGVLDALAIQPAPVLPADRTQPPAHGAGRTVQVRGDTPMSAPRGLRDQRGTDDLGGVSPPGQAPRRQQDGQERLDIVDGAVESTLGGLLDFRPAAGEQLADLDPVIVVLRLLPTLRDTRRMMHRSPMNSAGGRQKAC